MMDKPVQRVSDAEMADIRANPRRNGMEYMLVLSVDERDAYIKALEDDIESRKRSSARYSELAIRLVGRALKERDENYARARAAEERLHGK